METNKTVTVPVENVGQAYLEILRARGIKYFFGNSGTDFGPIIDGLGEIWRGEESPSDADHGAA